MHPHWAELALDHFSRLARAPSEAAAAEVLNLVAFGPALVYVAHAQLRARMLFRLDC